MTAAESGIKRMSLSERSLRRQALKLGDNRLQLQPHSISWSRQALLPVVARAGVPDKNRIHRVTPRLKPIVDLYLGCSTILLGQHEATVMAHQISWN